MSYIFDALRKSEAERSENDSDALTAPELLQIAECRAGAQRGTTVQSGNTAGPAVFPEHKPPLAAEAAAKVSLEHPVASETESSPFLQPAVELEPPQPESEGEGVKLQPPELQVEATQRDEVMKFVQHVFLMPGTEAPRTVVLTGTEPGNGCSWICSRAAAVLASQAKDSICVVDGNLRSPGLHRCFGVENHHGLSDSLLATEPIRHFVRPLDRQNLWLLSCGANATNCQNLLISDRMRLRLAELRQYFKYILIDAPALSLGSDGIVLGRAAEGVVLVLKANSSRREAARKAVQDLQDAGVRILGAVLNHRTFPIPQAIYNRL
jgi:capsular exopolysaccharide synthesis family protein